MKTAVGIAFAAVFATVVPLSAQEVKQTLSLDEAIAVTLTENPAMKAAEFEEKAATQERRAAIGLRMPKINVTGAYAYLGSGNADRPGTRNAAHNGHFDIDETALPIGAALYASYALWWLGQP